MPQLALEYKFSTMKSSLPHKYMSKILPILALLAMFLSCAEKKNDLYEIKKFSYDDVPSTVHLVGKRQHVEGMLYPRVILNLKGHLVVGEHKSDTSLHIIDKSSMQIIHQTGIMGRGPGEIGITRHLLPTNGDEEFWAYQLEIKKADRFDITSGKVFSEETIKLEGEMSYVSNLVFSSDSTYMTLLVDGNDKFVEFGRDGKVINTYDTWDHMLKGDLPYNIISSIHQGMLNVSKNKRYYIFSCFKVDRIEILDKESGMVTSVRGPLHHVPKFTVDNSPGYPMPAVDRETSFRNYLNNIPGSSSFYVLFSGLSSKEFRNGTDKYCNDIFEFDYEGNVKTRYVLDISIRYMAIDEEKRKIYGLAYGGEPDIVVFDF